MDRLTPAEAWTGFVGNQTPKEFWQLSHEQGARTFREAAERYVQDLPNLFQEEYPDTTWLTELLTEYLEEQLGR